MAEMLKIDNIKKTFNPGTINEKVALNGVNLSLEEGDFVTVIGGNGAGKSTTLNAIAGVWPVDEGKIVIDGRDVTKLPEYTILIRSPRGTSSCSITSVVFSTPRLSPVNALSSTFMLAHSRIRPSAGI